MSVEFTMDKAAIKKAAENFRNRLLLAKEYCKGFHEEKLINLVLDTVNPIINICIDQKIERPFALSSYLSSNVGRILNDELSHEELNITLPYEELQELLMGGMSIKKFCESEYYRKNLLPINFQEYLKKYQPLR